ncbi:hypothetical protein HED51_01190 [Ochrobactrum grignonense]|nr:hypothetical protein [Brucella grignonensis]
MHEALVNKWLCFSIRTFVKNSTLVGQLLRDQVAWVGLKAKEFLQNCHLEADLGSSPLAGFALRDYGASPRSYSGTIKSQHGIARYRLYFSGVH